MWGDKIYRGECTKFACGYPPVACVEINPDIAKKIGYRYCAGHADWVDSAIRAAMMAWRKPNATYGDDTRWAKFFKTRQSARKSMLGLIEEGNAIARKMEEHA